MGCGNSTDNMPGEGEVIHAVARAEAVRTGLLRMHLMKAHLEIHEGHLLDKMSVFVEVSIGDNMFYWKSDVKEHCGHKPEWGGPLAVFEYEVRDPLAKMEIRVRDHAAPLDNKPLGHAEAPLTFFAKPGGVSEFLPLHRLTENAGRIHFRSEFVPKVFTAGVVEAVTPAPVVVVVEHPARAPQPEPLEAVVLEAPVPPLVLIAPNDGGLKGNLKLHLDSAHITVHEGPDLIKMSPFVKITIGDFAWKSTV